MYKLLKILVSLSLFVFVISCATKPAQLSFSQYRIENPKQVDTPILKLLSVYKDSLGKSMNTVIGFSLYGLTKKQPESGLGNFMADAMKSMAEKKFNTKVDAAFVNYGGIRSYLPKGDITVGKMYELMPFDNLIVLQTVSGKDLQLFLNLVAGRNGWPVSTGLTFAIKDKQAVNILIDGKPIREDEKYTIANSDYVANGGDNAEMLKKLTQLNKFYIFRDALIEYTKQQTSLGKTIDCKPENRVVYAQ